MSERGGVLLVASSGGHLLQLHQLRDEFAATERHWISFAKADAVSLLKGERVTWAHFPTNRNLKNLVRNSLVAFRILLKERPRAVISTGAGVAVPFCYIGRLFGARVIFIESFSRVDRPSLTARLVYPVATRFFVQWPTLLAAFKRAEYHGKLL